MKNFKDLIDRWPSAVEFGEDIGVTAINARRMRNDSSVPGWYFNAVVKSAERRGISGVTHKKLSQLAERRFTDRASAQ